jgi:hypothetical protein
MEKGWQRIYYSDKMHLIEIVRAVLADQKIESVMIDRRDSSYVTIGDIDLFVRDEDAIFARLIIEQHKL